MSAEFDALMKKFKEWPFRPHEMDAVRIVLKQLLEWDQGDLQDMLDIVHAEYGIDLVSNKPNSRKGYLE